MSESETGTAVVEPADDARPESADVDPESGGVEETDDAYYPPFRPIPAPSRKPLHQRYRKWIVGAVLWTVVVCAVYALSFKLTDAPYTLTIGGHVYSITLSGLDWRLTVAGLILGFLVGLTGMGGGALMTPLLILAFKVPPTMAVGTDIAYAAVTKIFGSWRHFKQGSVDLRLALVLAIGSIPGSLLGMWTLHYIDKHYPDKLDNVLYWSLGVALVLVAAVIVMKVVMHVDKKHRRENIPMPPKRIALTIVLGLFCGFIIGLTSVGSGTFLAVCLILFYPLATDRIVGTDVFHAMILLGVTAVAKSWVGQVDMWMVVSLLLGSIPAVIVGSRLTVKAPTRMLRVCLAAVLYLSGLAMLYHIHVSAQIIAVITVITLAGIAAMVVALRLLNRKNAAPAGE